MPQTPETTSPHPSHAHAAGPVRDICYYDSKCSLCQRSAAILSWLDWFGRLEFRDMLDSPDLPVSLADAMQGMPMRTRDGRTLIGFRAARRALRQTPLGFVPALVFSLPGISWIGQRVYASVAIHRSRDACEHHAKRIS